MADKIAFISYETPYAPCGGIAAVMRHLPRHVRAASGLETVVITPYHYKIERTTSLKMDEKNREGISLTFEGKRVRVSIHSYRDGDGILWYFIQPEDKRFFAGEKHPYDVGKTQEEIGRNLKRDALFFGAAAARAVNKIGGARTRWALAMQDWEAATLALGLAGSGSKYKLSLTLHNSYDSGAITASDLLSVGISPIGCPGPAGSESASVLERALPLIPGKIFTVSEQFASDLSEDIFQAKVMAPHLTEALSSRLYGIDNGPFAELSVPEDILTEGLQGDYQRLQAWKKEGKEKALQAFAQVAPSADAPVWGDSQAFKQEGAVWFVMAGRDDPRQKGYDVAALAIRKFLERGGDARFIFFPIPGDEGLEGLGFLKKLAQEYPGHIFAFPFRFVEGLSAALRGAEYGIMPSLYEPFGMANEFYLKGTVGIGRATGGILQQIVPLRSAASFSRAVETRALRWNTASALPTGLLYRESDEIESAINDWQGINHASYSKAGSTLDRLEERQRYALFREMAHELSLCFEDGIRISKKNPALYYHMLSDGIIYIQRSFSWERAANEYLRNLI